MSFADDSRGNAEIFSEQKMLAFTIFDQLPLRSLSLRGSLPLKEIEDTADATLIQLNEWKWNRYLKEILKFPDWIDIGLDHRTRFEVYDHPWRSNQSEGQTDPQIQQRSRLRLGINGEDLKLLFELQDARVHLHGEGDYVDTTIKNEVDILQLLLSWTGHIPWEMDIRSDIHLGRFTIDLGSRRLIARNVFRNTTNAFDGLHWQLTKEKSWRIRAFLVEPTLRDDISLDTQSNRNLFWGVSFENNQMTWLRLNMYYFGLNDQKTSTVSRQRTFSTFGIRLYEKPKINQTDYEVESVWQIGKRGNTAHFAHFQHINFGYTFNLPWSPRFLVYYDYATGDKNGSDSQSSAFDTLFGVRRQLNPIGNFGPFFRMNLSSPGWRVTIVPSKGWKLMFKHRVWYMATSNGSFGSMPYVTSTNGVLLDESGGSGNYLGQDIELQANWKINTNFEFEAGYSHWFKGSYFNRLPSSADLPPGGSKDSNYFYFLTHFRM